MSRQAKIIVGAIIGVLLLSVGAAVFVMARQPDTKTETSTADMVKIEVRALPQMTVKKDGKLLGKTPVAFVVKKSTQPISLDTTWVEQRIYQKHGEQLLPREAHKDIVPDHDQTVDFTHKDAKPIPEPTFEPTE